MNACRLCLAICFVLFMHGVNWSNSLAAAENIIHVSEGTMVHLRIRGEREWGTFPVQASAEKLDQTFQSTANATVWTLSLRQQDVKQTWQVVINDRQIGRLVRDENDLRTDFEIPPGVLVDGENRLVISQSGRMDPDDIRVGEIQIHAMSPRTLRRQATLEVVITDQQDRPIPGRLTVVDSKGTLMPLGAESITGQAVREGVLYTVKGEATIGLMPGQYRLYAGRGFEYGVETATVNLNSGDRAKRTFQLTRQVNTDGWIACDTHVHTVTHSGHGDCTIEERMVTLAGEAIELPIATDHNKQIDYADAQQRAGAGGYFTPVIGNEVTTRRGHFNVFPAAPDSKPPNHEAENWQSLFDSIFGTDGVRVAILNHARDLHSNFRPFSPRHHLSCAGINLDGFDRRFNAMELINSGAVQTDPMELFGDWCGLINHGMKVTPVGSSDSHDVTRYIVGQGRTYIRCDDSDTGRIDIGQAVDAFLAGKVVVSYGLFARLIVNERYGPGELVVAEKRGNPPAESIQISVEILGPDWTDVDQIELWINGTRRMVRSTAEPNIVSEVPGIKARVQWTLAKSELPHDAWVSVVARGSGIDRPYWPTAKPYQPDSVEFQSYSFTSTGPVFLDVDGDGTYTSPIGYAKKILQESGLGDVAGQPDWRMLANRLEEVDPSVMTQAFALLRRRATDIEVLGGLASDKVLDALRQFDRYWQLSVRAQLEAQE